MKDLAVRSMFDRVSGVGAASIANNPSAYVGNVLPVGLLAVTFVWDSACCFVFLLHPFHAGTGMCRGGFFLRQDRSLPSDGYGKCNH